MRGREMRLASAMSATPLRILLSALLLCSLATAATAQVGVRTFSAGGGFATAGANEIHAVLGETITGHVQIGANQAAGGLLFGLAGDLTPVMLLDFTAVETDEGVRLDWHCADWEAADFRLEAAAGERQWTVSWQLLALGAFAAIDDSGALAESGEIVYTLSAREAESTDWILLGRTELALADVVARTELGHAHPNPFNPTTTINFSLSEAGRARLLIYDVAGRLLHTLVDGELPAGPNSVNWNGRDDDGVRQASGVYFLRMETAGFAETRRLVLLK